MKKRQWLIAITGLLLILCGCGNTAEEANVWMVTGEAPVFDAKTGLEAGTAYKGFMVSLENTSGNKAVFSLNLYDSRGAFLEAREYAIETKYMEKSYSEPVAVIEIISSDMIRLHPGAVLRDSDGNKMVRFSQETGLLHFIQKNDIGYMFTLDVNVLFAGEEDAELIPMGEGGAIY